MCVCQGSCLQGFFCQGGATDPAPLSSNTFSQNGPCPLGHYCPAGCISPIPCPLGSIRNVTGSLCFRLVTYWNARIRFYMVIALSQAGGPWRAAPPVLQVSTVPPRVWPDPVAPVLPVFTAPLTFLQPLRIHSSAPR